METVDELAPFVYKPLNRDQPSIRLLNILGEKSPDGLIRCSIVHATTETTYTCLSYVWEHRPWDERKGPKPTYQILLNGKRFIIGENLFEFLNAARSKEYHSPRFWIDAVCIDQRNIPEKTWQVQQMGRIYSHASEVICWLNIDPYEVKAIEPGIRMFREQEEINIGTVWKHWGQISHSLVKDVYWSRAWIIQEVMLARRPTLLIQSEELPLVKLMDGLQCQSSRNDSSQSYFYQFGGKDGKGLASSSGDESLLQLLARFIDRKSTIPQDRVFSLLSLCKEGSKIKVDYTIPESDLMFRVLDACKPSLCLCSAAVVTQALGLANATAVDDLRNPYPYLEIDIPAKCYNSVPCHMLLMQNMFYRQNFFTQHERAGIEHEYFRTCPKFQLAENITWRESANAGDEVVVYKTVGSKETRLCTYGEGFEMTRKACEGNIYTLRIAFSILAKSAAVITSGSVDAVLCGRAMQTGIPSDAFRGNPRIACTSGRI